MEGLTPRAIVRELNRYIVGQEEAKRAVAVALRNRERRRHLPPEVRREVMPKNLLMIGPTGVGKTEIARRVAGMIDAPFVKVEATKFTEVGYVGRDVESIIHELVEASVAKVQEVKLKEIQAAAEGLAAEKILDYLCQQVPPKGQKSATQSGVSQRVARSGGEVARPGAALATSGRRSPARYRQQVAELLKANQLEDQIIEIEVGGEGEGSYPVAGLSSFPEEMEEGLSPLTQGFRDGLPQRRWRRVPVREARQILAREEASKLVDFEEVVELALERVEESGVVFIDELDKLAGPRVEVGADISGEGVQRDLLPIVEGCTVMTRYGLVKTDHIFFIAAGTFYHRRPSDLIPEIQGRFPLRVELKPLDPEALERILTEPENALTKQYLALLATEGVEMVFTEDGIAEIARLAALMNQRTENIGARRLHTIMEQVLEELSYTAPEKRGERVTVNAAYVDQHLGNLIQDEDLSRYIL